MECKINSSKALLLFMDKMSDLNIQRVSAVFYSNYMLYSNSNLPVVYQGDSGSLDVAEL